MDAPQEQVYNNAVVPIVEGVLQGYNGAVIAYGQTGSGKTHTMIGNGRSKGIAPRAVAAIFAALSERQGWTVEVSVLEIYNERVRDLLAPGITHVDIHEHINGNDFMSFRCPDATRWAAANPSEALAALTEGVRRRETAATDMNHSSSRSHLIFTLTTAQHDSEVGATLRGRLHLVDLAGSERLKRSMSASRSEGQPLVTRQHSRGPAQSPRTPRDQRREAGEINKSLSQLALVIQRLTGAASSQLQYVPYRDSMLTRLLAESFGGSSKTCLIITCSALGRDREETRCSLEFGKRAKLVRNKAEINLEVTQQPSIVMQALVVKELENMQREREDLLRERAILAEKTASMQEQLSRAQCLLREAAADALHQQDLHGSEVRQQEEEKACLQRRWVEVAATAAEIQEVSACEVTRLRSERSALHSRLSEAAAEIARLQQEAKRHETEDAELRAHSVACERQLEERNKMVAGLRREIQTLAQDRADALSKLERENAGLRERWNADITRLEQEKATDLARYQEEKAELRQTLQNVLREASRLHENMVPTTEEAAAASRRAEEESVGFAAQCASQGATLRKSLEAARADVTRLERARGERFLSLEMEAAELQRMWRQRLACTGAVTLDPASPPSSSPPSSAVLLETSHEAPELSDSRKSSHSQLVIEALQPSKGITSGELAQSRDGASSSTLGASSNAKGSSTQIWDRLSSTSLEAPPQFP
eukprot:gnl/TRDRNA2_/TRDRNA2_135566_c1_seq2.p1 gnl/TRDRNA2_/TRDRNA2_135566_c1~~gnl/TRDRNA2_/TRDRNA2_135566_c1_seq2.p1  ORF type:complete len:804 (-),score=157.56 gnl/TRDRNA2_/TRDRNA2_135566_c1_seq2:52-2196(-)